jgi:hypothetical protein
MKKSFLPIISFGLIAISALPSFARNDTCTPDRTVTVPVAQQQCTMVPTQVPTGRNICTVTSLHQNRSADFVGTNTCVAEMTTQNVQSCQTVFVNTTKVIKGNCPPADGCNTGGHNCNHGGGPGG